MTATNHALTGAAIGFIVGQPLIALPVAFLSHFVCDALPHFGSNQPTDKWLKSGRFRNMLIVDASLCVILVLILAILHPIHWQLASVCAFLATSPDLVWINHYWHLKTNNHNWKPSLFSRFAGWIQWFQKPIGLVVEAVWFLAIGFVLLNFV